MENIGATPLQPAGSSNSKRRTLSVADSPNSKRRSFSCKKNSAGASNSSQKPRPMASSANSSDEANDQATAKEIVFDPNDTEVQLQQFHVSEENAFLLFQSFAGFPVICSPQINKSNPEMRCNIQWKNIQSLGQSDYYSNLVMSMNYIDQLTQSIKENMDLNGWGFQACKRFIDYMETRATSADQRQIVTIASKVLQGMSSETICKDKWCVCAREVSNLLKYSLTCDQIGRRTCNLSRLVNAENSTAIAGFMKQHENKEKPEYVLCVNLEAALIELKIKVPKPQNKINLYELFLKQMNQENEERLRVENQQNEASSD